MASKGSSRQFTASSKSGYFRSSPQHREINSSSFSANLKSDKRSSAFPSAALLLQSPAHAQTRCLLLSLGLVLLVILHILVLLAMFQRRMASCSNNHLSPNTPLETSAVADVSSASSIKQSDWKGGDRAGDEGTEKEKAPRFLLYRIIGNNMPPLQCPSQLLWNTLYALRHEGPLRNCGKRWVLNQILNHTEQGLLIDALLAHGYSMKDILIRRVNLTRVGEFPRNQWLDVVTAQNEARNAAIEDGVAAGARWILPFDGNHFLTAEAWQAIERQADEAEAKGYRYFKVPVHRLHARQHPAWLSRESSFSSLLPKIPLRIESQLAFRADAPLRFKPGMVYGVQNKLELLNRACNDTSARGPTCGCADLGNEGQPFKSDPSLAAKCGYSLRLWFYPCAETDPHQVFNRGLYRKRMRSKSRQAMAALVRDLVQHPAWFERI